MPKIGSVPRADNQMHHCQTQLAFLWTRILGISVSILSCEVVKELKDVKGEITCKDSQDRMLCHFKVFYSVS